MWYLYFLGFIIVLVVGYLAKCQDCIAADEKFKFEDLCQIIFISAFSWIVIAFALIAALCFWLYNLKIYNIYEHPEIINNIKSYFTNIFNKKTGKR